MFHGGMVVDGGETTMVVGEHQTVGGNDDTRTETAEVDTGLLKRTIALVEVV